MNTQVLWDVTLCRGAKRRLHPQGHVVQKYSSNVDDCLL